jgi:hypothetical protein
MISLRMSHLILVLTSTTLLPLAWASHDPINLMLAVACTVFATMIVVQARTEEPAPRRTARRSRSRGRSS